MADIKVGDVVHLRSGSPKMTVEKIGFLDAVLCVWFDHVNNGTTWGQLHRQWFVKGQLSRDY